MTKEIRYTSYNGYSGILYDPHIEYGTLFYQMTIKNMDNREVLHAYNATPKSIEQLKAVVDEYPGLADRLASFCKDYEGWKHND